VIKLKNLLSIMKGKSQRGMISYPDHLEEDDCFKPQSQSKDLNVSSEAELSKSDLINILKYFSKDLIRLEILQNSAQKDKLRSLQEYIKVSLGISKAWTSELFKLLTFSILVAIAAAILYHIFPAYASLIEFLLIFFCFCIPLYIFWLVCRRDRPISR
jgi:hypothetical protein